MILGESPEDQTFRNITEETLIEEWLSELEPVIAAEHSALLAPIVREGIAARHDLSSADTIILASFYLRDIYQDPEHQDRLKRALNAKAAFYGKAPDFEETGYTHIDEQRRLEREFLANIENAVELKNRQELIAKARRRASFIFASTTPGALAA